MVSFEEEYESTATIKSLCQLGGTVETSMLPNGVKVMSTGAAASSVVAVKVDGMGSAFGPAGGAFAAKMMSFKSAKGASDLKIQRELELEANTPQGVVLKSSVVLGIEGLPQFAEAAVEKLAVAIGAGRDPYIDWEFREHIAEVMKTLEPLDPLKFAIESASYGEGSLYARPIVTKRSLGALSSTDVYDFNQSAVNAHPMTLVGIGLDHSEILSYAAKAFAGLPPRTTKQVPPPPPFIYGGFSAKSSASIASCAVALPISDLATGHTLALCLSTSAIPVSYFSGLLVAQSPTASKSDLLKVLTTDLAKLTEADFKKANVTYETQLYSKTGIDLAVAIADGAFDNTKGNLTATKAALTKVEPSFAVVAATDDL